MARPATLLVVFLLLASIIMPLVPAAAPAGDGPGPVQMLDILEPRLLNATFTTRIPIIDGKVDPNEWDVAEGTEALWSQRPPAWEETGTHITGPGIQNDSDASHRFWAMYDDDYLYFLFNCSDDAIWVDNYPAMFWRDDGIELCIDGALDQDFNQRTDEGYEDGDTFAVPAREGVEGIAYSYSNTNQYARYWGPNRDWFSAVKVHESNVTDTYYVIEVAIRLNTIYNPAPAGTIGLNTGQNDDDDGNVTKEGVLRWQGLDGYRVWENETLWGRLYFRTHIRADAGYSTVINQSDEVTFDGSRSTGNHPDFHLLAQYNWTFMYGGVEKHLTGASPKFTFDIPGDYVVTLNVSDGTGVSDTDTVLIGVRDTQDPVANAGADQVVDQGTRVFFDASNSTDNHPDFPAMGAFEWFFIDDQVYRLSGLVANHTFNRPGEYTVRLTVTDPSDINTDTDTMTVRVRDTEPPVADAGPDVTVADGQMVTFDGSNSTDNNQIVRYVWEFYLDDDLVNVTGRSTKYKFPAPGVYEVTLTVYDADEQHSNDSMTVTVVDITRPVANAGILSDINEDIEITLNAELSFDNVGIVSYVWYIYRGSSLEDTAEGRKAKYNFTEPGLYDITLNVTDAAGLSSEDTIQLTVKDVTPPVARAGNDLEVDEDTTVTFSGSASTDNVGIMDWEWIIESAGDPRVRRTVEEFDYVFAEPGIYTVTLVATDEADNWDSDAVTVTVLDVTAPEVVVPSNIEVKVGQTVNLDGRGSRDNVEIARYTWTYVYIGVPTDLVGGNVTVVFDVKGNYTVTLRVEDTSGNFATDTFWVTVVKPEAPEEDGIGAWALIGVGVVIIIIAVALIVMVMLRSRGGGKE